MLNLLELQISANVNYPPPVNLQHVPIRRLFLLLTCLKHRCFTVTSLAHPPHLLAIVERNTNTHFEELFVTYFCASGCTTSCPDDEIIRAWMAALCAAPPLPSYVG
jgi:hypothetical protein